MNETVDQTATRKRRAVNVLVGLPLTALTIGASATQYIAWRFNYSPLLGSPIIKHAYWPWKVIGWWQPPLAGAQPMTFLYVKLGLMGIGCLGLLAFKSAINKKPLKHPTLHGTSRLATEGEVRKLGLLPDPKGKPRYGVILGAWEHKNKSCSYMTLSMNYNVIAFGPPRSGKTAGILTPTLLTWPHSAIVYDPKGEIYRLTAGWRKQEAGNHVLRWAPADVNNTVRWNPFDRVRVGTLYAYRDVANIMAQITDPAGKGPTDHWEPTAANFMTGLALYLLGQRGCNLSKMLAVIDASTDLNVLLKAMEHDKQEYAAQVGRGMTSTNDRERAAIISTARRLLLPYRDPIIAQNTSVSDFTIDQLMNANKPVSLYIEVRGEDELRVRPVIRLFLSLAVGQLISTPPKMVNGREVGPHQHPLKICLDEVASLGKMEPVEVNMSKVPGFDITFLLLSQDYEQIVATYGPHENITGQCQVLASYAPNNQKTRNWLSEQTGKSTVVVEEVSETRNEGKVSHNISYRSSQRPVMTPDEIGRIKGAVRDTRDNDRVVGPGDVLILHTGEYPIIARQSLAYLDPEFRRRQSIPAPPTDRLRSVSSAQETSPRQPSSASGSPLRAPMPAISVGTQPIPCLSASGK